MILRSPMIHLLDRWIIFPISSCRLEMEHPVKKRWEHIFRCYKKYCKAESGFARFLQYLANQQDRVGGPLSRPYRQ
ncbi:hypothetical protein B0T21DRAFT_354047 [Apiosordaria backusii]|uniref:Uncharacterized protein n=1 Tax=Apiosordaria backusii TaxID=314023 RepID=A0AA40EXD6_9PEZI|nr:hypothetical protein B0T21DRAFT_354047 [Apiosordaria backusii]